MSESPKDFRTPEARKWPEEFIPPETCGAIDDLQNAAEHLRDANSQLRHAAHLWKHAAEDELQRRQSLGREVNALQSKLTRLVEACRPFADAYAFWSEAEGPPHDDAEIDDQGKITMGSLRTLSEALEDEAKP